MPFFFRKGLKAIALGCACATVGVPARADEELPPPAPTEAEAETAAPETPPAVDSPLRLLEENSEVQEFARKLNEQLERKEPRKTARRRSAGIEQLRPDALSDDACDPHCPICGATVKPADDLSLEAVLVGPTRKPAPRLYEEIEIGKLRDSAPDDDEAKLLPGEPAQVILELRERLGASALEGSEFKVKPDALAKLIRALDREAQQAEQQASESPPPVEPPTVPEPQSTADHEAAISALRLASRQLDEAADVLEQQNLFERADELRVQADRLRHDARALLPERLVPRPPVPFQQTSADSLIEESLADAGGCERCQNEFMSVFASTPQKSPVSDALTRFNVEMANSLERFLGELGQISSAIDEQVLHTNKRKSLAGVHIGAPIGR